MNCFCGNPTIVRTSWTDTNPGRRFRCCSSSSCPIFSWVDPPMCARAVAIIPGLLRSRNALESSLNAMQDEDEDVANLQLGFFLVLLLDVMAYLDAMHSL
ncbi:hypothetical protein Tco_1529032 [Tanacetum coccineum]